MKKIMLWMALMIAMNTVLGGCNTAEGVGRDIEDAGKELQEKV